MPCWPDGIPSSADRSCHPRRALHAHPVRVGEVDEQHANLGVVGDVPRSRTCRCRRRTERRWCSCPRRERSQDHLPCTRRWLALVVDARQEEHVARLDEALTLSSISLCDETALQQVGQSARVELVLQRADGLRCTRCSSSPPGFWSNARAGSGLRSDSARRDPSRSTRTLLRDSPAWRRHFTRLGP